MFPYVLYKPSKGYTVVFFNFFHISFCSEYPNVEFAKTGLYSVPIGLPRIWRYFFFSFEKERVVSEDEADRVYYGSYSKSTEDHFSMFLDLIFYGNNSQIMWNVRI